MTALHQLAQETPVPLFINGRLLTNLLCTPSNLRELTFGWLYGQGIIRQVSDVRALSVCDSALDVTIDPSIDFADIQRGFRPIEVSGCGGGQINSLQYCKDLEVVSSSLTVTNDQCRAALSLMFERLHEAHVGPGVHCALIQDQLNFESTAFGFDIGRHNAVDKAVGSALQHSLCFDSSLLVTSGRISSDMMIKAAVAGIPVVASLRSVTTLAAEIAERTGIGICGALKRLDPVHAGNTTRLRSDQ